MAAMTIPSNVEVESRWCGHVGNGRGVSVNMENACRHTCKWEMILKRV